MKDSDVVPDVEYYLERLKFKDIEDWADVSGYKKIDGVWYDEDEVVDILGILKEHIYDTFFVENVEAWAEDHGCHYTNPYDWEMADEHGRIIDDVLEYYWDYIFDCEQDRGSLELSRKFFESRK